jgi:two-component system, OmpR family, sensor histidine kinase KdpD
MDAGAPITRPSAEDFLSIIRRQQLGKLKIYLGACPGVGKTYSMLKEGHRLKERGVDVAIGYVEPHERPETIAQIGDLEVVPPRVTTYHGITLREMDVDAVIARKPTVASSTSWHIPMHPTARTASGTRTLKTSCAPEST